MNGVNGSKLAGKIAEKGYNYTSLEAETGINKDTISNVVNGKNKPSYRVMNALYYTLEMTSEEATEIFFAQNFRKSKEKQEA